MDESLLNYVILIALTFVAGYLLKFVGPRARVVHWWWVLEEFRATRIREPKKRFYVVEERRGGANP